MLHAGQSAPDFVLPDADMESVQLSTLLRKHHVVLYFYPRDNAPSCTQEAIEFSDHEDEFTRHDYVVLGVSCDDCLEHAEFRDKHGLSVCLLSDMEGEVCRKYDVMQQRQTNGMAQSCIQRSTFLIDREGKIQHAIYGVHPRGHANEVIELIKHHELPPRREKARRPSPR